MMFPPSPALSMCDSLDGIDDLEAFLESQGNLSQFPTPPLKKDAIFIHTEEVSDSSSEYSMDDMMDYSYISSILAREASIRTNYSAEDAAVIWRSLQRWHLPMAVVSMGLNILIASRHRRAFSGHFAYIPSDLVVTAALSIATSWLDDYRPVTSWWSNQYSGVQSEDVIKKTTLELLKVLDWQLHQLASPVAIQCALSTLHGERNELESLARVDTLVNVPSYVAPQPLKLLTSETSARWQHGLLTPESTSPADDHDKAGAGPLGNHFLRLL